MPIKLSPARYAGRLKSTFVVTSVDPMPAPGVLAPPPLESTRAIAYDLTNEWPLYELDADDDGSSTPASLCKLMTAYILYTRMGPGGENVLATESVAMTAGDLSGGTSGGSDTGFLEGDTMTLHEWMFALLHSSDNAAAELIARHIGADLGGDRDEFITEMNTVAAALGMTGTTFTSPAGFIAQTDRMTPRDVAIIAGELWSLNGGAVRAYMNNASHTYDVTAGPNSGSFGPHANPVDLLETPTDAGVLAAKGGFHTGPTPDTYSAVSLWEAPSGDEIIIVTLHAQLDGNRYLDQRAIMYELPDDFSYLEGAAGTDGDFASVVLLAGFDGSIVDESSVGRTLTARGNAAVNETNPLNGTGDLALDGTGDLVDTPDTADMDINDDDFTVECYIRGAGSEPAGTPVFVAKWNVNSNQRQWQLSYDNSTNRLVFFVSTNGTDFIESSFDLDTDFDITPNVFFNGAKRHIMGVHRAGGTHEMYVNGVKGGLSGASVTTFDNTALMTIGGRFNNVTQENNFAGNIDEVRVTAGVDRTGGADKSNHMNGRKWPRS